MGTRVLIADDHAELRGALAAIIDSDPELELVAVAEDSEEAVELARRLHPEVALVDVQMPGGGGPRAARRMHRDSPETRVVAMSTTDDRDSVYTMLAAGAVGYITKGASGAQVNGAIHRVLRGETILPDGMSPRTEESREATSDRIARALTADDLPIAVQPIVEIESGQPVGFEALARFQITPWRSTGRWFADAAEIGLRAEIELYAMRAAVSLLPLIATQAFLSINISPETAVSSAAAEELAETPAARLMLEFSEQRPVADYDHLRRAMAQFRYLGGRIAVDNFGAGPAGLTHVLRIEPDTIKVDGEITHALASDRGARAVVSALVTFAASTGALLIAQAVETDAAVHMLGDLGVRYAQGYHFQPPEILPQGGRIESNANNLPDVGETQEV